MNQLNVANLPEVDAFARQKVAIDLYERSMRLGHRRVALLRYMDARDLSAPLSQEHHAYAQSIIENLSDPDINKIATESIKRSILRHTKHTSKSLIPGI